jgi:hypothetical protein
MRRRGMMEDRIEDNKDCSMRKQDDIKCDECKGRNHTCCVHLWWYQNKDGSAISATPSVLCERDGIVIDIKDVDANKCKYYKPPVGQQGEGYKERITWFDRNFKAFKTYNKKGKKEKDKVSEKLHKNPDGSHRYCTPEYYELCKSYENDL